LQNILSKPGRLCPCNLELNFVIAFSVKSSTKLGVAVFLVGILIVTMSFERYKEWKKMKEEISEELTELR